MRGEQGPTVSGSKKKIMTVMAPTIQSSSHIDHRHPLACTAYAEMTGVYAQ